MKKYTLVSLAKPVDSKGLSVGDIGIIIECKPHDVFDVMFFNKNALGDYLVANLFRKDFREIPYSLSQDWIAQFENGIDDIERKDSFKKNHIQRIRQNYGRKRKKRILKVWCA